jgi:hypothetical protein
MQRCLPRAAPRTTPRRLVAGIQGPNIDFWGEISAGRCIIWISWCGLREAWDSTSCGVIAGCAERVDCQLVYLSYFFGSDRVLWISHEVAKGTKRSPTISRGRQSLSEWVLRKRLGSLVGSLPTDPSHPSCCFHSSRIAGQRRDASSVVLHVSSTGAAPPRHTSCSRVKPHAVGFCVFSSLCCAGMIGCRVVVSSLSSTRQRGTVSNHTGWTDWTDWTDFSLCVTWDARM